MLPASITPVKNQPALAVLDAVVRYGDVLALAGATLVVERGQFVTILGPSGSGKTTLLKVIAGFEMPDDGKVLVDGTDITHIPPRTRNIGMVFQNYALFPHMTTSANIGFPLKMRRWSGPKIAQRVEWALDLVDLRGHGHRKPNELSGGQQQRVALARAIVFDPKLLLLDEPFGALDRKLREAMQLEVKRLQRRLGITTIFITHDQEEALTMSDRIAVMRHGQIRQSGDPHDIYVHPKTHFVAEFVGEANLLSGRVTEVCNGSVAITIGDGIVIFAACADDYSANEEVTVVVRPEAPMPLGGGTRPENVLCGRVVESTYLGNAVKYRVVVNRGLEVTVRWPARSQQITPTGTEIVFGWSARDTHVLRGR